MSTYTDQQQRLVRELHFAEDWGMVFELLALPRMAGRVWAALAMSEEPYLSAADLEDRLEASSGAVNGALQFLTRQGALERVRVSGQRRYYFGLRPGTMEILVGRRLAVMTEVRDLAARGIREFSDRPAARARFQEVHAFYNWFDAEMTSLMDRFRAERLGGKEARS
ncbi:MAG: hypothetical protein ABIJ48_06555 [Actinomycetota bacterium]